MHFHFVHISKYSRGNLFKTNLIFAAQTLNLHKSKARKQLDMAASLSFFLLFFSPLASIPPESNIYAEKTKESERHTIPRLALAMFVL